MQPDLEDVRRKCRRKRRKRRSLVEFARCPSPICTRITSPIDSAVLDSIEMLWLGFGWWQEIFMKRLGLGR